MTVNAERLENDQNLGKDLRLYDDVKEIIVTLDVGPRIMHISLLGKPSAIETQTSLEEKLEDGETWKIYAGAHCCGSKFQSSCGQQRALGSHL